MLRRNFLKYTSVVAAMALFPVAANAATSYTGPLWVFIQASGGWDPTSFCDPKGMLAGEFTTDPDDGSKTANNDSNPMNKTYANEDIATTPNGQISYAPLSRNGYDFQTFFEKFEDNLLVVNGIDTQTNGHTSGRRFMMSGRLSEGLPALSALIAGANIPSSPLAFVSSGGYDETFGYVAATRVGDTGTLSNLAFVNEVRDTTLVHPTTFDRLKQAKNERIARLMSKQRLESVKEQMNLYNLAHTGSNDLSNLVQYINDQKPELDGNNNTVFTQGRFALAGFKAGLTTSVNVSIGGFDSHSNHDQNTNGRHINQLSRILEGIDLLTQEAEYQQVADRVIFVVGSEFGRTPGYNAGNGKDHWSVSSMMFMGPGIRGGRVIGGTTHRHEARKVNQASLALDNSGLNITYAHVQKALRRLAGIHNNAHINQYFPLDTSIEDLNLFT